MSAIFKSGEKGLRVVCTTHKVTLETAGAGRIVCELGPHTLAERFPHTEFWEHCCNCEYVWPSALGRDGTTAEQCPVCGQATALRFLCEKCKVVSVAAADSGARTRGYKIGGDGAVRPSCPGCEAVPSAPVRAHDCEAAQLTFSTARDECPFCGEALVDLPAFPAPLAEYLASARALPVAEVRARFDAKGKSFEAAADGDFLLLKTGGSKLTIALPRATRLDSAPEFQSRYGGCYVCDAPAAGELFVNYPATLERAGAGGWKLRERGRLEVLKDGGGRAADPARQDSPASQQSKQTTRAEGAAAQATRAVKTAAAQAVKTTAAAQAVKTSAAPPASYVTTPLVGNPTAQADAVAGRTVESAGEPEAQPRAGAPAEAAAGSKRWAAYASLALVAVLLASAFAAYRLTWGSDAWRLRRVVEQGRLVRPAGQSAHDFYLRLKRDGASAPALAEFEREILPKLNAATRRALDDFAVPGSPDPGRDRWQELAQAAGWASSLAPSDGGAAARAAYCEGRVAYIDEDKARALELWKRAADLDKSWALAPNSVGLVYNEQRSYAQARTHLLEAVRRSPDWAVPYNNLGTSYYGEGNYRRAADYYRKAVERARNWARPHAWLGDIAVRQRDYETAVREFEIVLHPSSVGTATMNLDKIRQELERARQSRTP